MKKYVLGAAAAGLIGLGVTSVHAYPEKPVKLVVPFSPGSATDTLGRYVVEQLQAELGGTWIVENKPGASARIGTDYARRAPADGYTLLLSTSASHSVNPGLYPKLGYDPNKEFVQVSRLVLYPWALVTSNNMPGTTTKDFIEYARANPGKLNFGFGSATGQVATAMFNAMAGIESVPVSYKSPPEALTDLVTDRIQYMFADLTVIAPHVKANNIKLYAISTPERTDIMPDLPTVAESGLPNYQMMGWGGISAPAGTPQDIVDLLGNSLTKILTQPEVRQRLLSMGVQPALLTGKEFQAFANEQLDIWKTTIQKEGLELE